MNNIIIRAFMSPGLWLQSLSTNEPDDGQVEVAITALKEALVLDGIDIDGDKAVEATS